MAGIAARLGVSYEHLSRVFRRDQGVSPQVYLQRQRRRQAEALLADEELELTAVAEAVGYADLPAFSQAFRRWTGLSPGAWRRRLLI